MLDKLDFLKNPGVKFILRLGLFYLIWKLFIVLIVQNSPTIDAFLWHNKQLIHTIYQPVRLFFEPLGFSLAREGNMIYINGNAAVFIGGPCFATELMLLFVGLILAYSGPWKTKLWFVPSGVLAIHVINLFRVIGLMLAWIYYPSMLKFSHDVLFYILVYACIFGLWALWVRRFAMK